MVKTLYEILNNLEIVNVHDRVDLCGDFSIHLNDGTTIYIQMAHILDKGGEVVFRIGQEEK